MIFKKHDIKLLDCLELYFLFCYLLKNSIERGFLVELKLGLGEWLRTYAIPWPQYLPVKNTFIQSSLLNHEIVRWNYIGLFHYKHNVFLKIFFYFDHFYLIVFKYINFMIFIIGSNERYLKNKEKIAVLKVESILIFWIILSSTWYVFLLEQNRIQLQILICHFDWKEFFWLFWKTNHLLLFSLIESFFF